MKPSAMGTIAVHTELVITPKLAPELARVTDGLEGADALVGDRLDEPSQVGAAVGGPAQVERREHARPPSRPATPTAPPSATGRRWPSSTAAVTPTAGTKASTPPTSEPQIGMPSMRIGHAPAREAPTAVPMLRPPSRARQQPEEQERGARRTCP